MRTIIERGYKKSAKIVIETNVQNVYKYSNLTVKIGSPEPPKLQMAIFHQSRESAKRSQ